MRMWVGTSGYNYPEWKGNFYPQKLPAAKMLAYYAERFTTVEINYTFYRTPNEKILAGWNRETPPGFRLTLKAPKRITHIARLRECADLLQYFLKTAATLGPKLGAILFQLPPYFRRDLAVLDEFLQLLPPGISTGITPSDACRGHEVPASGSVCWQSPRQRSRSGARCRACRGNP